ncbi:MAG: phage tail fiber protein [Acidimicrobiales bacterium]
MTDQTLVDTLLSNILHASTAATWTPGTGGTALTITPPLHLRLYTTTGTETASGTENTTANSPGYTVGGNTMGTNAFAAAASGSTSNSNQVQWTATGTWTAATNGVEIWDTSATPVRILWGALTTAIAASAVTNGDTVTFAAASITANASTW